MRSLRTALAATTIALAIAAVPANASLASRFGVDAEGMVTVPRISELASTIAGLPVVVRCYPTNPETMEEGHTLAALDANGVTHIAPVIYLDGKHCGSLWTAMHARSHKSWMRSWWTTSQDVGDAAGALTHEAMHVRLQSTDEALVECTAYRNAWPTLKALGLPARFRAHAWKSVSEAHSNSSSSYLAVC